MVVAYVDVILKRLTIRATQHSRSVTQKMNLCNTEYRSRPLTFLVAGRISTLKLYDAEVCLYIFSLSLNNLDYLKTVKIQCQSLEKSH
jgi:hypothetical protein